MSEVPLPDHPARVVMHQSWRDLLFAHWETDPACIARTLPQGLTPDLYRGRAYVGVIPFRMCGVRPARLPAVPWLSNFLELNVRTYVRDALGRPGVWFYSLDCNQPAAVTIARTLFHLPYEHARMACARVGDRAIIYTCERARKGTRLSCTYAPESTPAPAKNGSLEEFLVERYRLYSYGASLRTGCVSHVPYKISQATFEGNLMDAVGWAGLPVITREPVSVVYSQGVDVHIHPLQKVFSGLHK